MLRTMKDFVRRLVDFLYIPLRNEVIEYKFLVFDKPMVPFAFLPDDGMKTERIEDMFEKISGNWYYWTPKADDPDPSRPYLFKVQRKFTCWRWQDPTNALDIGKVPWSVPQLIGRYDGGHVKGEQ